MTKILVGTCGYSYRDWVGPVYPEGTKQAEFLGLYAGMFPTVELDYTYYRMPTARHLEGMLAHGGAELTFSVKAHESLTHRIDPAGWEEQAKVFIEALRPLAEAGRLEAVLLEFPFSFHYTAENRRYLDRVIAAFKGASPLAVEFRNAEWANSRVTEGLKARGAALVGVDLPDLRGLPPTAVAVTSPLAYIRLHGRNAQTWWGSDAAARYDYLYNEQELQAWGERVKGIVGKAERILVYFNNHWKGKAVQNAKAMQKLLGAW